MKRSISIFSLTLTSISAIIGSGWLFASYYASTLAGPSALLSWILGGFGIIIIAFVFGEVCSVLPVTGSSVRIPQLTHGPIVGFLFAWIIWLSYATFAPTETQAVIQYASYYLPGLTHTSGALTLKGYLAAAFVMLIISFINAYSLRWLIRANSFLTIIKIIIPLLFAITIIISFFSFDNTIHPGNSTFIPLGIHGLVSAIAAGGIIFAFNGFKQAAEMAGEAKNPKIALPIAIVGSVVVCLLIFFLLQVAFFNVLRPHDIANGWQTMKLSNDNSPLAAVVTGTKVSWLIPILYIGAIIGPLAAGLMYCSSAARSLYGMSKNQCAPLIFQKLTKDGNPMYAVIANFFLGMLLFAPLPGWNNMAAFLSSLVIMTYSAGPITLLALRHQLPERKRIFHLPFAKVWTTVAFYICTLMIYWCGWQTIEKFAIAVCLGYMVLVVYQIKHKARRHSLSDWYASSWMWLYFLGIILISHNGSFGGTGIIPFGWDFIILIPFCIFILWVSYKVKLPILEVENKVVELHNEVAEAI